MANTQSTTEIETDSRLTQSQPKETVHSDAAGLFDEVYSDLRSRFKATGYKYLYDHKPDIGDGVLLQQDQKIPEGDSKVKLSVEGLEREYRVHVPKDLNKSTAPIVLIMHGTQPAHSRAISDTIDKMGFDKEADQSKFIAVYPVAQLRTFEYQPLLRSNYKVQLYAWNSGEKSLVNQDKGKPPQDDATYIKALLPDLRRRLEAPSSNLYGVGYSGGAWLVNKLASQNNEQFAGVASVKGTTFDSKTQSLANADTRFLAIYGKDDTMLPYSGGSGSRTRAFQRLGLASKDLDYARPLAQAEYWRQANNCEATANLSISGDNLITRYSQCSGKPVTEVFVPGGHEWPKALKTSTGKIPLPHFIVQELQIK